MRNRTFTHLIVVAALMLASLPSTAQTMRPKLQKAEVNGIVDLATLTPSTTEGEEQETYGEGLVRRLKAEGRKLPMPEEKLRRMKRGTRTYVRPVAANEKPLTFTGMLQYNAIGERMLLEYGFYKFSQSNGFVRETMADVDYCLNGRGAYYNHKLHGTASIDLPYTANGKWTYCEWDADTWEPTGMHGSTLNANLLIVKAADWDPTTGICYGWKEEHSGNYVFMRINYENMEREIIANSDSLVVMLAVNSKGQMYGVTESGSFCSIDKTNGKLTYIGSLDFNFYSVLESMTFDRRTDRLYMVASEVDEEEEEMYGRLCEVDVNTGHTTLLAYLPEAEEYTCLNVLEEPEDGAPAKINDMFVSFPSEGIVGVVNFSIPTTTVGGQALEGPVHYVLTVNDNDGNAIEGDAQPGDFVAKVINVTGTGRQKVVVQLAAGELKGERNVYLGWVGEDTPKATNVSLNYDEATETATVSWVGNIGKNGGFVHGALTYDVYRMPDNVKVANGISDTQFSEQLKDARFNGYYYKVIPFRGEEQGEQGISNTVQFGQPYEIPYIDNFEAEDAGNKYTVIDANNDGCSWDFINFSSTGGRMRYNYSKTSKADDWALTPPLHLVQGVAYEIKFVANSVSYPEKLSVACGMGTNPAEYTELIPETVVKTNINNGVEMTGEIKVQQTGDYYFGFHCTSDQLMNSLMIDNLTISAGQLLITPDSVRNLKLTAAEDGDLMVTIDFDAPTVCNDGNPLESISRIVITRGEKQEAVTTLTDVQPGVHYTYVDEDAVNGMLTYNVTVYNEAGPGVTASATVYVGTDVPTAPLAVGLADNLDGSATLSWQAPVIGANGGYVDADELTYNVYGVVNNQLLKVEEGISTLSYTANGIEQTGPQGQVFYGVSAENEVGESAAVLAAPLLYGAPYTLPFMEGFFTGGLKGIWATRSNVSGTSWAMYTGMSSDDDDCVTAVDAEKRGTVATLSSGKISLAGAETPKLVFAAYGDPGTDNKLKVSIQKNGGLQADTLLTINYANMEEEDFVTYAVDLSNYKDAKYIIASFTAELNDPSMRFVVLDDVNFRNVNQYDVAVYPQMQHRTTAGQKARMALTVHNVGMNEAQNYKVALFVNGKQVSTLENNGAIAPFDRAHFEYEYTTQVTDPENSKVWAAVEYEADQNTADNTSEQEDLRIVPTLLEAVTDLTATSADGKSVLQWTPVSGKNEVTESFEGYDSFEKSFGEWGNFDQDRCATAGINGVWWPGAGERQAFLTFNFRDAGVSEELMRAYPEFEANSGTQFLACFKALNASGNKNNDWLVSPELSGEEQTVTIYVQSLAGVWNETFEVLYSTTGNQVTDFAKENIIDEYEAPKNYFGRFLVNIPAGAKYFAIHCNSQNGGIMMVDDISYVGKELTLKGYNIYCDGVLVATAEPGASTYEHNTASLEQGLHIYHVSALYEEGESALSNAAPVAVIDAIHEVNGQLAKVYGHQGRIEIVDAKGMPVAIYTLAGQRVYRGNGNASVPVAAGQYLVMVNGTTTKIAVK